jgi:hypothetical protein
MKKIRIKQNMQYNYYIKHSNIDPLFTEVFESSGENSKGWFLTTLKAKPMFPMTTHSFHRTKKWLEVNHPELLI